MGVRSDFAKVDGEIIELAWKAAEHDTSSNLAAV